MKSRQYRQRLVGVALVLALIATMVLSSASGLAMTDQEMLVNGNFEHGFTMQPGCGAVGSGWSCFTNGGSVVYGFYDDQWAAVRADGAHSQLIELNTMQFAASESDRYAGIYQTVKLVKGEAYTLKLSGLMRERNPDPAEDPYRYRVQWGYAADGGTDWTKVTNWVELPWDKIDARTAPSGLQSYATKFQAPSTQITLFIRVWKKWGTVYKELDVNLDAISLVGKAVKRVTPDPGTKVDPGGKVVVGPSCGGANMVANGDFEGGFVGGVGKGWTAFNNGGRAAYGFYDEQWKPVIKDGGHGQLIEINTWGYAASDSNRYAGIYQVVPKLTKGATYELSLYGMLREEAAHPSEDPFRYRVQWGYVSADADPAEGDITNWQEISWDKIYVRTAPGTMAAFSVQFQAPSDKIVLAFRAWKKWGTVQRELDVNLDAITLVPCKGGGEVCIHIVQPGDTLSALAKKYGTSIQALVDFNHLSNANILVVGQRLTVPCTANGSKDDGAKPPPPADECIWHVVKPGDTLFKLAMQYNSTVALIVEKNQIANPNLIRVGQKLCIIDP